ncbi:RING-box protein 1b [Cryptococcus deuterogattii 99/473]|uniref:Unplaced genomic scaffold supercont1.12, whole genome shotgun sequence n=1 Tax=Cryptococcus deuterogattii Ram5 TaxID=1296110 RepID=A0A0D0TU19_9TREE|nr:RING-box protein 1b [Cryptococcus deuterogattii LA55]KIR32712.1 RING-box protein 1b [Cryptococcus deuterogattii MMRL2647]KIR39358.1 RING-box protein 1b [Cryptococcus deuterogattii Ram5]KIR71041.1 RING-box protein 1b [Cryptococcus deuterogattii CA1014]KIR94781.1 RING-box protein 1b [Cryptococcus deuterogattii CBS 10090]KIY54639.1 RING-box protein 1b [Cryptococcus deuterogattii 99/473]
MVNYMRTRESLFDFARHLFDIHPEMEIDQVTNSGKLAGENDKKPRFEVKKWNAVALWAWDIAVDNCAICKSHIMDLCMDCQANQGAESENAWGICNVRLASQYQRQYVISG